MAPLLALACNLWPGTTAFAQQTPRWEDLPLMEIERFYRGPLKDTVIQRWRDPETGAMCYVYMPIIAEHMPTEGAPYVRYGANQIGSVSCVPAPLAKSPG